MNRLSASTSPYLLQHKDNPVDWWEWSDAAFVEARRRDVPVLLSVGYSACHWCHVMAHESFDDDTVAAQVNSGFVSVKVDREERPDVDAVYMEATQALTGQGGWPMTCLLTPDGQPFWCGTYLPRTQFVQLLHAASEAWTTRREEIVESGQRIVAALSGARPDAGPAIGPAELDAAAHALVQQADRRRGGFGGAPKFPPAMVLEFLQRHHERTGSAPSAAVVAQTCEAMARGGMYDQLGGGFARYSVDADWVVPHFEKMLYDNALLTRLYTHVWRSSGSDLAERVARETAEFMVRDLGTGEGGFASALDADTDGVEGLTYVWTPGQLTDVLGADDGEWAAALLTVTEAGTFEHGTSTLQLRSDPDDAARWSRVRAALLDARGLRPQPGRDDKVVTSWNGLAVTALAELAATSGERRYYDAAVRCADLLLTRHLVDGRLRRTSRDGVVGASAGLLEDYGALAEALLTLHQVDASPRWLADAGRLLDTAVDRFCDFDDGVPTAFYDTADDAERLIRRPWDPTDNATPSGQSALAAACLTYSALTGSGRHRAVVEASLGLVAGVAAKHPRFAGWSLAAAEGLADGPRQVAVVGEDGAGPLTSTAWRHRSPGGVIVSAQPDAPDVALLADRPLLGGRAAAYVCRGMVCDLPVTTVDELSRQLSR